MAGGRRAMLAVLAALLGAGAARAAGAASDPSCGVVPLVLRAGATVYVLPHSFIRAGSDSAWTREGRLRPGTDYVLDRLRGQLRLVQPPAGDTLWFAGCWLLAPPPLELQLMHYRPPGLAAAAPQAPAGTPPPRPATQRDPTVAP